MDAINLGNHTLLARTAYVIMCFERYVISVYPNTDFTSVAAMMWQIVDGSDYLDEAAYRFSEIIPESLFEFSDYKSSGFDYLVQEQYDHFISVLNDTDQVLNMIMLSVYDIAMSYCYTTVEPGAPITLPYLQKVIDVMETNNIELPDLNLLSEYTVTNPQSERKGDKWMGDNIDRKTLSILL